MKKTLRVLLSLISISILIVLIMLPQMAKKNPKLLDIKKYEKEDLDMICGVTLRESKETFQKEKCIKLWNNRNVETKFDQLTFYLFDTKGEAKKALRLLKDSAKDYLIDEGEDFVKISEPDSIDAYCEVYFYQNKNLIVKTCTYSYSEKASNPDEEREDFIYKPDEEELIALIRENF